MKNIFLTAIALALIMTGGYYWEKLSQTKYQPTQQQTITNETPPKTTITEKKEIPSQVDNSASRYCIKNNGTLAIKKLPNGSEYGVCDFGDGKYCEEWALFRGECPIGGVKIAGYDNNAQRYCAITGGKVDMKKNICTKNGKICDIDKYYNEKCSLNK